MDRIRDEIVTCMGDMYPFVGIQIPISISKMIDFKWHTGVMPQAEYDAMFAEVKRAYALAGKPDAVETTIHQGPHKVDNEAAFQWLTQGDK